MAEKQPLSAAEIKLIQAAGNGQIADWRTAEEAADDPAGAQWGEDRKLGAEVVRVLLIGAIPDLHLTPAGLRLRGARICGALNLAGLAMPFPLEFIGCRLERATVGGSVHLHSHFLANGAVQLDYATIGGSLICAGGSFQNSSGVALSARDSRIKGKAVLANGFRARGAVLLDRAAAVGELICSQGAFENPGGIALSADSAQVAGDMLLNCGFRCLGAVSLEASLSVEHLM